MSDPTTDSRGKVALIVVLCLIVLLAGTVLVRAVDFGHGDAIQPVEEPTLQAADSAMLAPATDGSIDSQAEAYVSEIAFEPNSNDLTFLTRMDYPHSRAVFHLDVDDVSGEVGPTATLLAGLPPDVAYFHSGLQSSSSETHSYVIRGWLPSSSDPNISQESELYMMPADATSMEKITGDGLQAGAYQLSLDGETLYVWSDNALVALDTTSGTTTTIASDLIPPGVMGGPLFTVSPDGSSIGLVRPVDNNVEASTNSFVISTIDLATNDWTDLWNFEIAGRVTAPVFSTDGSKLYYVVSTLLEEDEDPTNKFECAVFELDTAPGSSPIMAVNLMDTFGPALGSVAEVVRHPSEDTIFFLYDVLDGSSSRVYSYSFPQGALTPETPESEFVIHPPIVTSTNEGDWLGYVVAEPLDSSTHYEDLAGGPLSEGWFARILPLQ